MQSRQEAELPSLRSPGGAFLVAWQRLCVMLATLVLVGLVASRCTFAQAQQIDREYTIKAAFLYHFLTYIDWPTGTFADPQQPFVIGVFQTDPFGAVLDKIAATKNVGGRRIEIRRLDTTDRLLDCHIVFVPGSVPMQTQETVLRLLTASHVLAVGETDEFVKAGGAAQFFVEGNKVRFAFNTDVVDRSNLKVSSKLLSLAKIVTTH